jgi:predicted DNA binding protein
VAAAADAATDVSLAAKRERTTDPGERSTLRTDLDERLTDRQRTVLRTAYVADYFASPRGSTAEEVATALDVTGPTVLYHLRAAQRKLLGAYFDVDPSMEN